MIECALLRFVCWVHIPRHVVFWRLYPAIHLQGQKQAAQGQHKGMRPLKVAGMEYIYIIYLVLVLFKIKSE